MPADYTSRAAPPDQFVALLISLLNIALRPQRKAISAEIADRLYAHMRDATAGGDPIYDLLTDLLEQQPVRAAPVTQAIERPSTARSDYYGATEDPEFVAAVGRRRYGDER